VKYNFKILADKTTLYSTKNVDKNFLILYISGEIFQKIDLRLKKIKRYGYGSFHPGNKYTPILKNLIFEITINE